MAPLADEQDAYGHMLLAHWKNEPAFEVVERDDGYVNLTPNSPQQYFAPYEEWHEIERIAIANAHGRTLDIGCGAGRVGLYLQHLGHPVFGIDNSPHAVETCRLRGWHDVKAIPVSQVNASLGKFDTIIMYGNNFGLLASPTRAEKILAKFHRITNPGARLVVTSRDIYQTDNPVHFAYHERNRRKGRMPGQIRLRIRFLQYKTPWFDYLMVSPPEMAEMLQGTGWEILELIQRAGVPYYAAIIEKR